MMILSTKGKLLGLEPVVGAQARAELLGPDSLVQEPSASPACGGLAAEGAASLLGEPGHARVAGHGLPVGEDDLVPGVEAVLGDAVGVEDFGVLECPCGSFLSHPLVALADDLAAPHLPALAAAHEGGAHAASALDPDPDEEVARLGSVAEGVGAVQAGGVLEAHDDLLSPPADEAVLEVG